MHETSALVRCVFAQNRYLISFLLVAVVVGEVSALAASMYFPNLGDRAPAIMALFLGLMPSGIAALVLFDYGHSKDLMSAESGCSEWMLRMPIPTWKLAVVPIALKTIWVSTLWFLLVNTVVYIEDGQRGVRSVPVVDGCIFFSAVVIWLLAISWRPFRNGWFRLGALIAMAIVLWCGLAFLFLSHSIEWIGWRRWAIPGSYLFSLSLYASGVWYTLRSTELARTSSRGLIPARGRTLASASRDDYEVRDHVTARRALVWHDLERARPFIQYTLIFATLPAILIATFFVPLHAATAGMALFLFPYLGVIGTIGIGEREGKGLPPYLAGSPLGTATIAWTRLLLDIAIMAAMSLCVVFVFMGWAFWPENRAVWFDWASQQAYALGSPTDGLSIGIRYSLAIVVGSFVLFWGRVVSFLWISMAGRSWLNVLYVVVGSVLFLVPAGMFLRWFMHQTSWESTTATMYGWLVWVPYLVGGLLAIKAVCVSAATITLWRSRITSHENIVKAVAWWCVVTLAISVSVFALIPDPRATFLWCLIATVLAIPLARVLALPVSLAYNRHR